MSDHAPVSITHDRTARRFYTQVDGGLAVAAYEREGDEIVFTHTDVPSSAEGQGVGSALAREALNFARKEGLRVVAQCAFFADYLARHPEYAELTE